MSLAQVLRDEPELVPDVLTPRWIQKHGEHRYGEGLSVRERQQRQIQFIAWHLYHRKGVLWGPKEDV